MFFGRSRYDGPGSKEDRVGSSTPVRDNRRGSPRRRTSLHPRARPDPSHRSSVRTTRGPERRGRNRVRFSGYGSVVEEKYAVADMFGPFDEVIARDAFKATLKRGCDTAFLLNHDGISMARTKPGTLKLSSDSVGLHVDARLNPSRDDVKILRAAVADGDLDAIAAALAHRAD